MLNIDSISSVLITPGDFNFRRHAIPHKPFQVFQSCGHIPDNLRLFAMTGRAQQSQQHLVHLYETLKDMPNHSI